MIDLQRIAAIACLIGLPFFVVFQGFLLRTAFDAWPWPFAIGAVIATILFSLAIVIALDNLD